MLIIIKGVSSKICAGKNSGNECVFPFNYEGTFYNSCIFSGTKGNKKAWCATEKTSAELGEYKSYMKRPYEEWDWDYCNNNCKKSVLARCNENNYPDFSDVLECCTKERPCDIGEGHCANHDECKAGLECGAQSCNKAIFPYFDQRSGVTMSCCIQITTTTNKWIVGFAGSLLLLLLLLSFILYRLLFYKRKTTSYKRTLMSKIIESENSHALLPDQLDPSKDLNRQISTIQINLE